MVSHQQEQPQVCLFERKKSRSTRRFPITQVNIIITPPGDQARTAYTAQVINYESRPDIIVIDAVGVKQSKGKQIKIRVTENDTYTVTIMGDRGLDDEFTVRGSTFRDPDDRSKLNIVKVEKV